MGAQRSKDEASPVRRRWVWPARGLRSAFALGMLALVWGFFLEPRRLVVRETVLPLPRWPAAYPPLRVALVSDLHVGSPHWGIERLPVLVDAVNAAHPDLVVLAGDYVIDGVKLGTKVAPEPIARGLRELRAPLGVVAVLGNHDWWNDGDRIRRVFEAQGIVVLENETRTLDHHGRAIVVAGLADPMTRRPLPGPTFERATPSDAPILAIVHGPDIFPELDDRPAIVLAGHTHGGQVWLPLVGRLVVPSRYGQRFAAGHVVENGRHLFVTTGVGTSILPVRFAVPPEVALLTLRARYSGAHLR